MNPYQNSFGGNIPQDVAGKQGENVIFIVYTLKDTPETLDKVKDVCANFSAMIRSMRNRFPELMFSCTMGFGADAWSRLFPEKGKPKELNTLESTRQFLLRATSCFISVQNRWGCVLSLLPSLTRSSGA